MCQTVKATYVNHYLKNRVKPSHYYRIIINLTNKEIYGFY